MVHLWCTLLPYCWCFTTGVKKSQMNCIVCSLSVLIVIQVTPHLDNFPVKTESTEMTVIFYYLL